jgi:phosphatidylglycerol:prolipoprotein diacylglycerol transferase
VARRKPAATTRKPKARSRPSAGTRHSAIDASAGEVKSSTGQTTLGASTADEPQALVVSHWFDSGQDGEPYSATIRLTGRRLGIHGQPKPSDSFVQDDKLEGILPGSGPVSFTSWVYGLKPGEWSVTADLIRPIEYATQPADRWRRPGPERLSRAKWSWRRRRLTDGEPNAVATRWALLAPLARIPAVIPGSFTLMGTIAIVTAIAIIAVLLAREGVSIASSLVVSLLALVSGLAGAKLWYAVLHPGPWRHSLGGWSVDGFLVIAPVVAVVVLLSFNLPIGAFLDAATPGIFFAVAIGRFGCFLTGCCAGRCTRSRWGVWSSDRRIGARRVPAQLLESGAGLIIGLASLVLVLAAVSSGTGLVFLVAVVAYVIVRQFLLRVRAERREFSWRRSRLVSGERT